MCQDVDRNEKEHGACVHVKLVGKKVRCLPRNKNQLRSITMIKTQLLRVACAGDRPHRPARARLVQAPAYKATTNCSNSYETLVKREASCTNKDSQGRPLPCVASYLYTEAYSTSCCRLDPNLVLCTCVRGSLTSTTVRRRSTSSDGCALAARLFAE